MAIISLSLQISYTHPNWQNWSTIPSNIVNRRFSS